MPPKRGAGPCPGCGQTIGRHFVVAWRYGMDADPSVTVRCPPRRRRRMAAGGE